MRNPNRIPIVLNIFKNNLKCCMGFLGTNNIFLITTLKLKLSEIEKYWKENSDQRLEQVLHNLCMVPQETGNNIYHIEEDDWLIKNGYCNIEDIKFWGVNYYKNGKKRKTVKFKLLKDLDIDHIKNIIKFFEDQNMLHKLNKEYLEYFNKQINEG